MPTGTDDEGSCAQCHTRCEAPLGYPEGAILHSDRGSQYTASAVMKLAADCGWNRSFSRVEKPGDSAWSESFFSILKKEIVHWRHYSTRELARQKVSSALSSSTIGNANRRDWATLARYNSWIAGWLKMHFVLLGRLSEILLTIQRLDNFSLDKNRSINCVILAAEKPAKVIRMRKIYVIGDSTVENGNDPYYGWGGQLEGLVSGAQVDNHAFSGRSSKSFWDEKRFEPVVAGMRKGDILLVCFGHNDEKDDAERHTDPESTFPEMLMKYVNAARAVGAVPVLCTSVSRNYIGENGFVMYTHGAYPHAVRELCAKENILLIDLERMTRDLLRKLGQQNASDLYVNIPPGADKRFPDGIADKTHFNLYGAKIVAEMVAGKLMDFGFDHL